MSMGVSDHQRRESKLQRSLSFEALLCQFPPGRMHFISDLGIRNSAASRPVLIKPRLKIYCDDPVCCGVRYFDPRDSENTRLTEKWSRIFLLYACANCRSRTKVFALMVRWNPAAECGEAVKLGEWPPFGPVLSPSLLLLAGNDRQAFINGRRAEIHGLGFGALTYYLRAIERQQQRFVDKIAAVRQKLQPEEDAAEVLQAARAESRFERTALILADVFPPSLVIDGHNPLMLLNKALRMEQRVHTEREALKLAAAIRILLTELADRIDQALKDRTELTGALDFLLRSK
jgi:hypothetical protein